MKQVYLFLYLRVFRFNCGCNVAAVDFRAFTPCSAAFSSFPMLLYRSSCSACFDEKHSNFRIFDFHFFDSASCFSRYIFRLNFRIATFAAVDFRAFTSVHGLRSFPMLLYVHVALLASRGSIQILNFDFHFLTLLLVSQGDYFSTQFWIATLLQ